MNKPHPRYPVYIISKGRAQYMYTSRTLAKMGINHYIVIEPQDEELYKQALIDFKIKDYVTIIVAPFSNHGDGPGRARNYCWDHAITLNSGRHWVLDDNIRSFYRLYKNKRYRVGGSAIFRAAEDFVDRYENVPIAGFQYKAFAPEGEKFKPFIINTRIYSCLLIDNNCKHRWRGRYNEDTDICLRVLKDGDCTVQFYFGLQDKMATQVLKGGNTQEFYHAEGTVDKSKWRDGYLNHEGTIKKSQMLVDLHPDVARVMWRYGRWHHFVDYGPYRHNKLKLKPNLNIPKQVNNYGMYLINNYDGEV